MVFAAPAPLEGSEVGHVDVLIVVEVAVLTRRASVVRDGGSSGTGLERCEVCGVHVAVVIEVAGHDRQTRVSFSHDPPS